MKEQDHIILIHGTWCHGDIWGDFKTEFVNRGFTVHTPTQRYHDLPFEECAKKVGMVGLKDYVDDLSKLVETFDSPPLILGHSLGCLMAQLLAARHPNKGLILMGPAPSYGMFPFYPTMLKAFLKHFLQWGFWKKPLYPDWEALVRYIMNIQPLVSQKEIFEQLVPESGRVYTEMAMWFLDPKRSSKVNFKAITSPVLIISGTEDKVTVPRIARLTAAQYERSTFVLLSGSDHMYPMGKYMPTTLNYIDYWLKDNGLDPGGV
ncbi:MAG: alpha/beta fold hydrolase [Candidatus Saccharibacteria bacterium]